MYITFDDLSLDTDYYLYVRSICSEEDFSDWETFSFDTKYCPISFQYTDYYINSVSSSSGISNFENITNAHSPTGYGNYATSHQVNQEAGKNINISININATSSNKIKAYVDWNHNLTFDESEQVIDIDNNTFFSNPTTSNSTITIPAGTPEGAYRLRIVLDHTHSASACGDWNNGEAEDYTINVIAPCNTPTGLSASYISDNGATISWTAIEGISEYEYYLNKTGVPPTSTTLGIIISSTVSNIVIDENTEYYLWVRSICAATHRSEWSAVLNFNNICTAIENVSISEITANTATITWDPTVSNSYEYIISTENTPPTLTSTGTSTSINTVTNTALAGNNDYYVWVRNVCSSTLKGSWTAVSTFRTQCETANELPLSDQTIVHTQENGETLDYKDDNCKILNSIVAHEGDLGTVTSSVKVQPAFESSEGKPYIGRYYDIHTTINNAAIVTLYFTDEDINSYNTLVTDSETYPAITAGSTDLKTYIYHSEPASGINGIEVVIPSLSYNSETGLWQITFETSGFSGFFVGTEVSTPLSIDILDIDT